MSKTILIVEDNELNMRLFTDLLEAYDYNTILSCDGSDAVDLARDKKPGLIIMDIQLPGMSGIDITKILKADRDLKHIPVIAVTAFALKGDEEEILEAGFASYILKPISVPKLLDTVAELINN